MSELRKQANANPGVLRFFQQAAAAAEPIFISAITVGELHRGIQLIRYRDDAAQAAVLEAWLTGILDRFAENILVFDADAAQVWGRLRVPDPNHELDKQIAAIALVKNLTVVTRNTADFAETGVSLINPFATD